MGFSTFLFGGFVLSLGAMARAQCSPFIPIHEVVSSPGGVMTIDDEAGSRQISAQVFNTADCHVSAATPTGVQFAGNYTMIGQMSTDSDGCEVVNVGGVSTLDSVQAVKVTSDGWTMDNVEFHFDDLDSSNLGWREVAAVVGLRAGSFVMPTVTLASQTLLSTKTYNVVPAIATLLDIGTSSFSANGAEYSSSNQVNCPFEDSVESRRCRAIYSFSAPIDTVVILYAVLERGRLDSKSGAFFSEFRMSCGCRCRQTNPGTRTVLSAVPGVPGECVQRVISSPRSECDVLGAGWCSRQDTLDYILSGGILPSGNYECTSRDSSKVGYVQAFAPSGTSGTTF